MGWMRRSERLKVLGLPAEKRAREGAGPDQPGVLARDRDRARARGASETAARQPS